MSHLLRGICELKKPPANEITELLAFTVCKLVVRGKAIVLHYSHILGTHILGQWSAIMGKTEGKRYATKQKGTEEQLLKCDYKESI